MPSENIDRISVPGRGIVSFESFNERGGEITLRFILTGDFSAVDRAALSTAASVPARSSAGTYRGDQVLNVKMLTSERYERQIEADVTKYVTLILRAMEEAIARLPRVTPRKRTVRNGEPAAPVEGLVDVIRRQLGG